MHTIQRKSLSQVNEYLLELTSSIFDDEEQISYTTYGISVKDLEGQELLCYNDISTNRSFVEAFIELCNKYEAAAIHIPDLLEDYLD